MKASMIRKVEKIKTIFISDLLSRAWLQESRIGLFNVILAWYVEGRVIFRTGINAKYLEKLMLIIY